MHVDDVDAEDDRAPTRPKPEVRLDDELIAFRYVDRPREIAFDEIAMATGYDYRKYQKSKPSK